MRKRPIGHITAFHGGSGVDEFVGQTATTATTITTLPARSTTTSAPTPAPGAGTFDPSFGEDGLTTVPFTSSGSAVPALAGAVAIDADGRIVVAGEADVAEQPRVAVARLLTDGSPDESFGERGSLLLDQPGVANGVLLLDGGGMVITGTALDSVGGTQLLLVGLLEDGSPDVTFGTDGQATVGCDVGQCSPLPPVRQSGGRIVIAVTDIVEEQPFEGTIAVLGFDREGRLDPSFGSGGIARLGAGSAGAVALDASGRVVIVGSASDSNFVVRLSPDGAVDTSFGTNGIITFPHVTATESWNEAVVITGDRIVVAGGRGDGDLSDRITLTRFDDQGRLDTSYGAAGTVEITLSAMSYPAAMVTDQFDRTTVAGVSEGQFVITRVDQTGQLDTTFGSQGITLISFAGPGPSGASSMVADADGRLVVAGYAYDTTYTFALARLLS